MTGNCVFFSRRVFSLSFSPSSFVPLSVTKFAALFD